MENVGQRLSAQNFTFLSGVENGRQLRRYIVFFAFKLSKAKKSCIFAVSKRL